MAPRGQATRPTSDRVREALFSMLTADGLFEFAEEEAEEDTTTPMLRVLDLYSGSGALGLEALSRGATAAVLVESARPAVAAINENVRSLRVDDQVTLLAIRVERALDTLLDEASSQQEQELFNLILIDPPYADVKTPIFHSNVLAKAARLLAASGILVLEHSSDDEPEVPGLHLDRRRRHGDTTLSFFVGGAAFVVDDPEPAEKNA